MKTAKTRKESETQHTFSLKCDFKKNCNDFPFNKL